MHGQSDDIHRGRYSAPNARPREKEYRDVDAMTEFITRLGHQMFFRTLAALVSIMTVGSLACSVQLHSPHEFSAGHACGHGERNDD